MYRKYQKSILLGAIIIGAITLGACASTGGRAPDSVEDEKGSTERRFDGREPASLRGDFTWLNEVGEDFDRIASETSSRAVASDNRETLVQKGNWRFSYLAKSNNFYVTLNGETYKMVQTSIGDGESYAFAAEGQADNPVTLTFVPVSGRKVASSGASVCNAELAYWSGKTKSYVKENHKVVGKSCNKLIGKLREYIP